MHPEEAEAELRARTGFSYRKLVEISTQDRAHLQRGATKERLSDPVSVIADAFELAMGSLQLRSRASPRRPVHLSEVHDPTSFLDAIRAAQSDGFTAVIDDAWKLDPGLDRIRRAIVCLFGGSSAFQIWWSGPRATGAAEHRDMLPMIVLQLKGSKEWTLATHQWPAPHSRTLGEVRSEPVLLNEGDALIIPEGLVHATRSSGEESIHLALQFVAPSVKNLLSIFMHYMMHELPVLRGSAGVHTPIGPRTGSLGGQTVEAMRQGLSKCYEACDAQAVFKAVNWWRMRGLENSRLVGGGRCDREITAETVVALARDAVIWYAESGGKIILRHSGGSLVVPSFTLPVIEALYSGMKVAVADLPSRMSISSKLVFVTRLAALGILEVTGEDQAGRGSGPDGRFQPLDPQRLRP